MAVGEGVYLSRAVCVRVVLVRVWVGVCVGVWVGVCVGVWVWVG